MALNTIFLTNHNINQFKQDCYNAEKRDFEYFKIFSQYSDSGEGAYRIFNLLKNSFKWATLIVKKFDFSEDFAKKFKILSGEFSVIASAVMITGLPSSYIEYYKAKDSYRKGLEEIKKSENKLDEKNIYNLTLARDNLIKKTAMHVVSHSFLIQFLERINVLSLNKIAKNLYLDRFVKNLSKSNIIFSNNLMLLYYVFSLKNSLESYINYKNLESKIEKKELENSKKMKTIIDEQKKLAIISSAKVITSLASQIITFSELAIGVTLVSATTALAFSTLSVLLAIYCFGYKRTLSYGVTYLTEKDSDKKIYVKDQDITFNKFRNKFQTAPAILTA
jgi:hypothetical protein